MDDHNPTNDSTTRAVAALRTMLARLKEAVSPSYRPELHYMRGRGPACARRTDRAA